jgi:hypothetical protein
MKISTVRDFRNHATGLMRAKDPTLVTRRGRLAGIFFPISEETLPLEFKREIFGLLVSQLRRQMQSRGLKPDDVVSLPDLWRKPNKREAA